MKADEHPGVFVLAGLALVLIGLTVVAVAPVVWGTLGARLWWLGVPVFVAGVYLMWRATRARHERPPTWS